MTGPEDPMMLAAGGLRASDADRERAVGLLWTAFERGRLTRDELQWRIGEAYAARTFGELTALATVAGPPPALPPRRHTLVWWGAGLSTGAVMVAVMVAATLLTGSQDLFVATVIPLVAYSQLLIIGLNFIIAAWRENRADPR